MEKDVDQVIANAPPMAGHLSTGINLESVQARSDLHGFGTQPKLEDISQAVGRVGGDHKRAPPALCRAGCCCRSGFSW